VAPFLISFADLKEPPPSAPAFYEAFFVSFEFSDQP